MAWCPAIYGNDAFGWNKPKWGPSYCKVLQAAMDSTGALGLVAGERWHSPAPLILHWGKPGDPNGSAWVGRQTRGAPPHYFREWRIDDLRTMVLNGIAWAAKIELPAAGVQCKLPELGTFQPKSVEPTWLPPKWK